jgi:membrane peptidoglycan carboxypeptidase
MSLAESLSYPQRPRSRRLLRALRTVLLLIVAVLVIALAAGAVYVATLPGVGDARARAQRLMAAHHEPAGMPVPPRLAAAVIVTEDEHFKDNVVLNVATGAGRAGLAVLDGGTNPGGATIDQQLAKQLYGSGTGLGGTLRQIGLGIRLGLHWSHHELLAMYLNVNYYGNGFWGARQASEGYFHTAPSRLSWAQAAMLAGLLQAPSAYDPLTHPALARERREHVLDQLVANGKLSARQARRAAVTALAAR